MQLWQSLTPAALRWCIGICILCLASLALAYYVRGAQYLVAGTAMSDAIDLRLRWSEQRYFLRGQNPYDMWLAHSPWAERAGFRQTSERRSDVDSELGISDPAHPPWAYVTGLLFLWPAWPEVRWYYLLLNTVGLGFIAWVGRSIAPREPAGMDWLLGVSVVALGSVSLTLGVGQYGIVVLALLAAALWLMERRQFALSGLFLALALVKPTLSGPFLLIPLLRRQWSTLATAIAYLAAASAITWVVVGTDPATMLRQLLIVGAVIGSEGNLNAGGLALSTGLGREHATVVGMVAVLLPAALLLLMRAAAAPLIAFAIAAVAARFWTYHKTYDDLILSFLLLALGCYAWKCSGRTRLLLAACFFAVGVTLWAPPRLAALEAVRGLKLVVWIVSTGALVLSAARAPALHDASERSKALV